MKTPVLRRTKAARVAVCVALLNFAVPGGALVTFGAPAREGVEKTLAKRAREAKGLAARRAKSASRLLSTTEERGLQGRAGENPYLAGQSKWDVVYKGVNLMTGNFSTSATDLSFDGGYGIPVNVTRSYSANNMDEGPFGKGWTLSADVRSTVGGLLKSASAPVRAVPVGFKERPAAEADPNAQLASGASATAAPPVEAVIATDAGGEQETVQKDVDGVLTTPPWDTNVNENTQYEFVQDAGGATYQVMTHNETVTVEGTRYVYDEKGEYLLPGGMKPWNDASAAGQPANVLKVVSATDRQGNVTTYTYGSTDYNYAKSNGATKEKPLVQVNMPGGHVIQFAWGTSGNAAGRVTSITDWPGDVEKERKVQYQYSSGGLLWKATTPGGKTTVYLYGNAAPDPYEEYDGPAATGLLTSITDPRNLTTTIQYTMGYEMLVPYMVNVAGPLVTGVTSPNGTFDGFSYGTSSNASFRSFGTSYIENGSGVTVNAGTLDVAVGGDPAVLYVAMKSPGFVAVNQLVGMKERYWEKYYEVASQNLNQEVRYARLAVSAAYDGSHSLGAGNRAYLQSAVSTTGYNFMGAPLWKTVTEHNSQATSLGGTPPVYRSATVEYAYWGREKYFQQKAVRDQANRVSFTDYYPSTAPAGLRGQTLRVFDPKRGGITGATGTNWRATVAAPNPDLCSASFHDPGDTGLTNFANAGYDAKGRPTDVWKLQKESPWSYVRTHTTYGADGYPVWGQASQVVEDYGTARINRTTETLEYTSWGKASRVKDAKGQIFETDFDKDGLMNSVTRKDGGLNQAVVTYTYGTTAGTVSFGQPVQVVDGLSGISQTISYATAGGGIGQPSSVAEANGPNAYTMAYTYGPAGDRATSALTTQDGTTRWGYSRYVMAGTPDAPSRPFTEMTRLDANWNRTAEEMHYAYDSSGRLVAAAFAQTPQANQTYASAPAASRARSEYDYDAGGRLLNVATYWDVNGGPSTLLAQNQCGYEVSGNNRGLKTSSEFTLRKDANAGYDAWTETYGYDPKLDYLTGADYGDLQPNATPSWSYDAAGNRNDVTAVDNLNRATTINNAAVTNDILGNRLTKGGLGYGWDCLNRLQSLRGGVVADYLYRADGMRVTRDTYDGPARVFHRYRYDGQTPVEDRVTRTDWPHSSFELTRYAPGPRGVDMIEKVSPYLSPSNPGTTTVGFPVYDAHGNNVATVSRSGTNSYALTNRRSYDAWGQVRQQQGGGDPKLRYCANLGHRADDESGLTYMRARYYDPACGRFVSEDPARDGGNWFQYCANDPINGFDADGKKASIGIAAWATTFGYFLYFTGSFIAGGGSDLKQFAAAAVVGLFKLATGEAVTFFPLIFPTLNRVALTFALLSSQGNNALSRRAAYTEFWVGYGMFLAFAIDSIDGLDDYSERWKP